MKALDGKGDLSDEAKEGDGIVCTGQGGLLMIHRKRTIVLQQFRLSLTSFMESWLPSLGLAPDTDTAALGF